MDLKAFKGMPHEFGGIDYTDGSEVEGGEFAVNIGKSGNEYIFDKDSSEGAKLSKEYKRLDTNGRLGEDDPIALETFNQIAKEEALKHAQRSVNEKGVDPFRNMYDEGGKAANGGVKYCDGGVNNYATGGVNPRAMGADPYMMDPLQMQNQPLSSEMSGGYEIITGDGASYINNLTGTGRNDAIGLRPQDNLSYNTLRESEATDPMTSMPTMDSYQLPAQSTPEMPTADASYDVSSADIGASGMSGMNMKDAMSSVTKPLSMASDAIQAINPETKQGSPWEIPEIGNKRQKAVAPQFAWSTSGEMMDAGIEGMSQGAAAGPLGAMAGMMMGPIMKGMADAKANEQLQNQFKGALMAQNAEERSNDQWDAIGRDVDSTELIDKDRYAGISQRGRTSKQGGALPKNKSTYGYYANGGGVGDPTTGAELIQQARYKRGVDTLASGITYQDQKSGRSYPVYDDLGNEIAGERNIGASSLSPGFNIRTNTPQPSVGTNIPQSRVAASPQLNNTMRRQELSAQPLARQSAPQYYAPTAQEPCDDAGLNQNVKQGFNLYNEPLKYAQKGNYYNPEFLQKNEFVGPPEMSITDPLNPDFVGPPEDAGATLTNNETGQSYGFKNGGAKKGIYGYYANGGGKKKKGTVLEVNPENVTADGSQVLEYPYLLDEVVVEDKLDRTDPYAVSNWSKENDPIAHSVREAGSDFMSNATGGNLMPSNAKAYIHGILGRRKPFTEADLTPSEIEAMSKSLDEGMGVTDEYTQAQYDSGVPKYDQNAYVSYDDWNRQGASSLYDNTLRHLTDPASRMKTLVGSSPVTDGGTYRDVGPNKYDFDDYTDTPFSEMTFLNMAEHIYNQSPFIKEQKSKGKPPMNMRFRIPKKTK